MPRKKQQSVNRRRSSEDSERDKCVYDYLLRCLTDLGISGGRDKPNESSIANQWGQKNNRIFIRRVLRSVLTEHYEHEKEEAVPGLTLGKLVEILAGIQDYWVEKASQSPSQQVPRILTRVEKLKALCKLSQLSLQEQEKLKLTVRSGEVLMQHLIDKVTDPVQGLDNEELSLFYKAAFNLYQSFYDNSKQNKLELEKESLEDFVALTVEEILKDYLEVLLEEKQKQDTIKAFSNKVLREINCIEFQCGLQKVKSLLKEDLDIYCHSDSEAINSSFVRKLTRSVVENEILTDEFPIYIKHITVEKIKPLPLYPWSQENTKGLLNPILLEENEEEEEIKSLKTQIAYKVTVHFYIKIENYQPSFPEIDEDNTINNLEERLVINFDENRLDFYEEITGVGSLLSHIIAAINRVVLWDIPILKEQDYMPVVREILNIDELAGQSGYSPVWCHNLVNLCKRSDIEKATQEHKNYDEIVKCDELAYGEFCGFDFMEAMAKASLHARLRAIKQTGINPQVYITQVCHRVEELYALKKAKSFLNLYPFSLKAMEGYLGQTIFRDGKYRNKDEYFNFSEEQPGKPWSLVAYDAHLAVAKSYFLEGLYRIGKKYLDVIQIHVENGFLNDLMLANYELCQFRYHNLNDLEDPEKLHSDRYIAVQSAVDSLYKAKEYLKLYLRKYQTIREFSQTNFYSFFHIFSRIYANEAKLYIFDFAYINYQGGTWDKLIALARLLEKARIYAAQDGNANDYSYWSAYQSWAYLMLAYLQDYALSMSQITTEECLDWTRRLVNHAVMCYSITGKKCYQAIKDNGGKITPIVRDYQPENQKYKKYYEEYGKMKIQVVPLIEELKERDVGGQFYDPMNRILRIDTSLLKKHGAYLKDTVYLFGPHSAMLLFATGMLELCEEQKSSQKLEENIKKALRIFTYCWATAESGNIVERKDDEIYMHRRFEGDINDIFGDSLIMGLYPHRLTRFAGLGKIFAAVCRALLSFKKESQWQEIEELLENLHKTECPERLGQKRYNGHLANLFRDIKHYFQELKQYSPIEKDILAYRDKVVKNVFRIILGDRGVKP